MRPTRFALHLALAAMLGLVATAATAQSDDQSILEESNRAPEGGTSSAPPPKTEDEELDEQVFYSGMGVAQAESEFTNLDKAVNLQVVLGFRIPTVKWFGIEIDIDQTIIPGENRTSEQSGGASNACLINPGPFDPDGFPNGCSVSSSGGSAETVTQDPDEFAMQALGLSAVLKSTGRFYVTGRYGYRYLITSIEELDDERGGNGFGAGVGYRWGKTLSGVELNYQQLSESVDALNLTFFARFGRSY